MSNVSRVLAWLSALLPLISTAQAASEEISFERVRALIEKNQLRDLSEVLPLLPSSFRKNFNLFTGSASLQAGSFQNPRVVMFSDDGRFVMAFNGAKEQRGFDKLEMIQFRDDRKEFEFRSIKFPLNGTAPIFSEANPKSCRSCHGQNPRPILGDSGDFWSNSYGNFSDRVLNDGVRAEFKSFVQNASGHPRYGNLLFDPQYPDYPFSHGSIEKGPLFLRPGLRLSTLVGQLNGDRLAAVATASPFFKKYPATTLTWLLDCAPGGWDEDHLVREFLLPQFESLYPREEFAKLYATWQPLYGHTRRDFLFERLVGGVAVDGWTLDRRTYDPEWPWWDGVVNIHQTSGHRILASAAASDRSLSPFVRRISFREFSPTRASQFQPELVYQAYNSAAFFLDPNQAQRACPLLLERRKQETGKDWPPIHTTR